MIREVCKERNRLKERSMKKKGILERLKEGPV